MRHGDGDGDEEEGRRAADACAREHGDGLARVVAAAFLAGAEWERARIIRTLETGPRASPKTGSRHADGDRPSRDPRPGADDRDLGRPPSPPGAAGEREGTAEPPSPRSVGETTGPMRDRVLAIVTPAGPEGISRRDLLVGIRGDTPPNGRIDNTIMKSARRELGKTLVFEKGRYRRIGA